MAEILSTSLKYFEKESAYLFCKQVLLIVAQCE